MANWSTEIHLLRAFTGLAGAGMAVTLALYWAKVCPVLYRHGARFPTGLALHRFMKDLHHYHALQRADARTADLYYALVFLTLFTAGAMAAAVVVWLNWWLSS
jgi:hypothetical protein